MRNDSADAKDSLADEAPSTSEAAALAAINASWQDESERTDVMQPRHLASHFAAANRSEREQDATTRHTSPPPRTVEDPHWDDEAELTNALDFERLAPWHAPSEPSDGDPAWEVAVTNRIAPVAARSTGKPAANGGRRSIAPVEQTESASELRWIDDMLSPIDAPALPRPMLRGLQDLSVASDPTPTPGVLEASPWPARPRESAPATVRPSRTSARTSVAPPAQLEQLPAPPAYESQAVRKSQVARARLEGPSARAASELPAVFPAARAQRPSGPAAPALPASMQPPAARHRTGAATLPARGRVELPRASTTAPVPAWITQSRAPVPAFNPPPRAADIGVREIDVRPSGTASWMWLSAGAAVAVVLAIGFRLWSEVTADLQPRSEVSASAATVPATAPIAHEETGFSITSRPAGAQVYVDGKSTGLITPARVRRLSPGLHAVDLKLPGYYDTSLPAVLQDGATLELAEVELRPLVAAEPPAVANGSGGAAPKKAAKSRRYRARRYAKQSIASIEQTPIGSVPAEAHGAAEEAQPLAEATGEGVLQINSRPWARVLIDDKFVGNTPQRGLRVSAGRHVVKLVNEPLNMSKTFTIDVRDGETITKVESLHEQPAQSGAVSPQQGESAMAQVLQMRVD